MARGKYRRKRAHQTLKSLPIQSLELNSRIINILESNGIKTVSDILSCTEEDILSIRGIGNTSISDIRKALGILRYIW